MQAVIIIVAYFAILEVGWGIPAYLLARKLHVPHGWVALVPLGWLITLWWCGDRSWANVLLFAIPIYSIIAYHEMWHSIAEEADLNPWMEVFGWLPIVGGWWVLALATHEAVMPVEAVAA